MKIKPHSTFKRPVKGSYNSQELIDQYLLEGKFPKIHDHIGKLIKYHAAENEPCLDLGSCIGLMAIQNISLGRSFCLGIEGNKFDYQRAVPHKQVRYENFFISPETEGRLIEALVEVKPTLITARRIFPEISTFGIDFIHHLAIVFKKHGVNKIVLQGRVKVKNPKTKLYSVEQEIECFKDHYNVKELFRQCCVLEMK